jgi:hypothetical protein
MIGKSRSTPRALIVQSCKRASSMIYKIVREACGQ